MCTVCTPKKFRERVCTHRVYRPAYIHEKLRRSWQRRFPSKNHVKLWRRSPREVLAVFATTSAGYGVNRRSLRGSRGYAVQRAMQRVGDYFRRLLTRRPATTQALAKTSNFGQCSLKGVQTPVSWPHFLQGKSSFSRLSFGRSRL